MYRAGINHAAYDGVSAHALRHTAAADMLRSGAHVRDVQAALGHAHLVTTERYLPTLVRGLAETMAGRRYSGAHRGG
jgi:site-specific recombinase XerD